MHTCALPSLRQRLATCFNIIDFWLNTSNPCKALLALARNTSSTRMSQRAASCLQRQPQPHPQHTADNVLFFTVPHPRVQQSNCQPSPTHKHILAHRPSPNAQLHTQGKCKPIHAHTRHLRARHIAVPGSQCTMRAGLLPASRCVTSHKNVKCEERRTIKSQQCVFV